LVRDSSGPRILVWVPVGRGSSPAGTKAAGRRGGAASYAYRKVASSMLAKEPEALRTEDVFGGQKPAAGYDREAGPANVDTAKTWDVDASNRKGKPQVEAASGDMSRWFLGGRSRSTRHRPGSGAGRRRRGTASEWR
jgi:hypothetical protein